MIEENRIGVIYSVYISRHVSIGGAKVLNFTDICKNIDNFYKNLQELKKIVTLQAYSLYSCRDSLSYDFLYEIIHYETE